MEIAAQMRHIRAFRCRESPVTDHSLHINFIDSCGHAATSALRAADDSSDPMDRETWLSVARDLRRLGRAAAADAIIHSGLKAAA